jgi:hypothetical protein
MHVDGCMNIHSFKPSRKRGIEKAQLQHKKAAACAYKSGLARLAAQAAGAVRTRRRAASLRAWYHEEPFAPIAWTRLHEGVGTFNGNLNKATSDAWSSTDRQWAELQQRSASRVSCHSASVPQTATMPRTIGEHARNETSGFERAHSLRDDGAEQCNEHERRDDLLRAKKELRKDRAAAVDAWLAEGRLNLHHIAQG